MIARNYSLKIGHKTPKLSGQARIVYSALQNNLTPRTSVEITATIGEELKTRQERNRVVLYYILVFKSKGIVESFEQVTKSEESSIENLTFDELTSLAFQSDLIEVDENGNFTPILKNDEAGITLLRNLLSTYKGGI